MRHSRGYSNNFVSAMLRWLWCATTESQWDESSACKGFARLIWGHAYNIVFYAPYAPMQAGWGLGWFLLWLNLWFRSCGLWQPQTCGCVQWLRGFLCHSFIHITHMARLLFIGKGSPSPTEFLILCRNLLRTLVACVATWVALIVPLASLEQQMDRQLII